MSRGPGKIERAALAIVESTEGRISSREVAARVYDIKVSRKHIVATAAVTEAQSVAARRALNNLKRRGLIFEIGRGSGRNRFWLNERQHCIAEAQAWQNRNLLIGMSGAKGRKELRNRLDNISATVKRGLELMNE